MTQNTPSQNKKSKELRIHNINNFNILEILKSAVEIKNLLISHDPRLAQSSIPLEAFCPLYALKPKQLSFCVSREALHRIPSVEEAFVLVPPISEQERNRLLQQNTFWIEVQNPYLCLIELVEYFEKHKPNLEKWIDPSAQIHPTAVIEGQVMANAQIGPFCVVFKNSIVGENCVLESHNTIYSNVTLEKNCILQAGASVGSRGFGYTTDSKGVKAVPHYAGVYIEEGVQIGAQSVVAAGFLQATYIGKNSQLDSFVQIGHNVILGESVFMASQSGIAGSTQIGDFCEIGGGAQIAGHLKIGNQIKIAAKSGVTRSFEGPITLAGFPATSIQEWRKEVILSRKT